MTLKRKENMLENKCLSYKMNVFESFGYTFIK